MTEKTKNKSLKIVLIILLILLAIYLIIAAVFSQIALPGTYVNGKDISYASKSEALASSPKNFNLEIKGRDGRSLTIKPEDIDYQAEVPADAKIDQNPFAWPLAFLTNKEENFEIDYKVIYDEKKLDKIIDNSSLMNGVTEPQDAKIEYKDGKFVVQKEVEGNKVDKDKLKKEIIDSINTKNNEIALDDSFYVDPKLKADSKEIQDIVADANKINAMKIKFNFNGFDYKLEGSSLIDLMDLKDTYYELNYDKVQSYVNDMAEATDTYGKNRTFNATGIGEIVVRPGSYGFKLDVDATIDKIYELVDARKSGDIEPVYSNTAYTRTSDGGDIGDTYVELDLSRQKMWFYKNGELIVESSVVTGRPLDGWASNVGVGAIQSKEQDVSLKGVNFDRKTEYDTKVKYWMPAGWDGEGFHDAPWRAGFGGDIYMTDGSHGCYNLPPEVAKKLFENVEYLTPVVVYESSTSYSPAMTY